MATTAFVTVVSDVSQVPDQLTRDLTRIINQVEIRIPPIEIRVEIDQRAFANATDGADRTGLSFGRLAKIGVGLITSLAKLTTVMALGVTTIGAIAVAASSAAASMGGMSVVTSQLAGAFGVLAASKAVLQIALIGVSDAFGALTGTAEEFEEATKNLAPAAREVAGEYRLATDAFKRFQIGLQNALFTQLEGERTSRKLATAAFQVQASAQGVAAAFGRSALAVVDFATKSKTVDNLNTILKAAAPLIERVTDALISVAGGVLDRAAEGVGNFGESFSGLRAAFSAVKAVAEDVGRIFSAIQAAAERAGVSLAGPLALGLDLVADLFTSKAGGEFLDVLVELGTTLVTTVVPIVKDLFAALLPLVQIMGEALTPVIERLGPPLGKLIEALGEALGPILEALGPILIEAAFAVDAMVDALLPFIEFAGELIADLLPILTPLLTELAGQFRDMEPLITQLAETLTEALKPILDELPGVLSQVVEPLGKLSAELFPILIDTLIQLTPHFIELSTLVADLAVELAPLIEQVLTLSAKFLEDMGPSISFAIALLIQLNDTFFGLISGTIRRVVIPGIRAVTSLLRGDWVQSVNGAITVVVTMSQRVVSIFTGLVGRVRSALAGFLPALRSIASSALGAMRDAVVTGIARVLAPLRALPGQARSALGDLSTFLFNAGASLIGGFISGIKSQLGAVKDAVGSVLSGARNLFPFSPAKEGPFSGRGYTTYSGATLADGLVEGFRARLPVLQRSLASALGTLAAGSILTPSTAGTTGTQLGAAAVMGRDFRRVAGAGGTPNVFVSIGNEAIDQYVTVRAETVVQDRDRRFAQGVRR